MSERNLETSGQVKLRAALLSLVLVTVLFVSPTLDAGSVFMKNGYVIQGPVVERSASSIVVGWDNGKVTIHRRFVASIVYEPGEKERLEEWGRLRTDEERALQVALTGARDLRETSILPQTLEEFFEQQGQSHDLIAIRAGDPGVRVSETLDVGSSPADGGLVGGGNDTVDLEADGAAELPTDTAEPVVSEIPDSLGERIARSDNAFSLRPPAGWTVRESADAFQVVGKTHEGVRPSLNVVELERGDLSWEDCVDLVVQARGAAVDRFESLGEGMGRIGVNREAFELIGNATHGDRTLVVRQVLAVEAERVWLLSSFTAGGAGDPNFALVEDCLASLEFEAVGGE